MNPTTLLNLVLILITLALSATATKSLASPGMVVAWGRNNEGQAAVPATARSAVAAIAAGGHHTLALKDDGRLLGWGSNSHGQTNVPVEAQSGVAAVAGGGYFSVALKDGRVLSWGANDSGQTTVPATAQSDVRAISAGFAHVVVLKNDGTVIAWGRNNEGQTTVPTEARTGVVAIAAGGYHTVALKTDGRVVAWGLNSAGQRTVPSAAQSGVAAIAAGGYHTVALKTDGSFLAWGDNTQGQSTVPAAAQSGVMAMAGGGYHTTVLKNDATIVAWGRNSSGERTVPDTARSGVIAIAAGDAHSVAIVPVPFILPAISSHPSSLPVNVGQSASFTVGATGTGPLSYQWRFNGVDLTGATGATLTLNSVQTNQSGNYNVVVSSPHGSVTSNAAVLTVNRLSQTITFEDMEELSVSDPAIDPRASASSGLPVSYRSSDSRVATVNGTMITPVEPGTTIITASQEGDATWLPAPAVSRTLLVSPRREPPVIVASPLSQSVYAGQNASFTVTAAGYPLHYQWKRNGLTIAGATGATLSLGRARLNHAGIYSVTVSNDEGSLTGTPAVLNVIPAPPRTVAVWGGNLHVEANVPVAARSGVVAIAAGGNHTIALKQDGTVLAWGYNGSGQTTAPAALSGVAAVAAGSRHTVVLKNDGTVLAWGDNEHSQTTVPAAAQSGVLAIAASGLHTVALKDDGTVVAWGDNTNGQSSVPPGLAHVAAIAAGTHHTIALKSDGTVVAWGMDWVPGLAVPVATRKGIVGIAAGLYHSAALKHDGTIVVWGSNGEGQTIIPIAAQSGVAAIACGGVHTMALKKDGSVVVWGGNSYGQSTVPAGLGEVVAIAAGNYHNAALVRTPPSLIAQPLSQSVSVGGEASFSVIATGTPPLTYQWRKNGSNLADGGITSGANTASLNLADVMTGDAGSYTVVVSNSAGSATSAPAVLTVNRHGQTITFPPLKDRLAGSAPFDAGASASSGLPVSYTSSNPNVATVSGSIVTLTGTGSTTITATQDGDGTWLPAAPVSRSLTAGNSLRSLPVGFWPGTKVVVTIHTAPPVDTIVYALEDLVPSHQVAGLVPAYYNSAGVPIAWVQGASPGHWTVGALSHGGEFDPASFKVKFGPFFDDQPRTLTYELISPAGITESQRFSGIMSLDGVNQNIAGDSNLALLSMHPADNNAPADNVMTIDEVTAYAFAWKKGLFWSVGPNAIPISYMTRAGALWKGGEYYRYDASSLQAPPLRWVNVTPPAPLPPMVPAALAANAVRKAPVRYSAGVPTPVNVTIAPDAGVSVYAVEEQLPAGWTATGLNNGGAVDIANRKIKWGPFYDNVHRTLSYEAVPPQTASGVIRFAGSVSFDGSAFAVAGTLTASTTGSAYDTWKSLHFGAAASDPAIAGDTIDFDRDGIPNLMEFALGGEPTMPSSEILPQVEMTEGRLGLHFSRPQPAGVTYAIQASSDLTTWTTIATLPANRGVWTGDAMVTETGSGDSRNTTVQHPAPINATASQFLRLHVSRN